MAKPPNEEEKNWLKLPGMKSGPLIYDKETGHVYTFPDFKCADSQLFATKIHSPRCGYFVKRAEPASHCTATWKKGDGHFKGHGPPGRMEMELMAFWWQVVLYMLAKHRSKCGEHVVEIVYQEWPFAMKKIFQPMELAAIMRSTLVRYRKMADAGPRSPQGMKRTIFLKSHYQFSLDTFISELKKTKDWWGPFEEGGTLRLCCNIEIVLTKKPEAEDPLARNSSPMSDTSEDLTSDKDLTAEVNEFEQSLDPENLTGVKFMLEAARLEAERRGEEADQLRRALGYLNYSIVTDGSELTQERIDEIIKIGEMAEMEGIGPGYLISSSTESTEKSPEKIPASSVFRMNILADSTSDTLRFPLFTSRPVIIGGRPSNINGTPGAPVLTATGEVIQLRVDPGEISQIVKQVRFAETLVKESKKIGSRNEMDVYAVPLTKSTEPSSTFERFVFGQADGQAERRTVLVLGADGSGQTRFINGIINFVFDVEPNDKFRFQLIDEQAPARRTDCINIYDLHHASGFRVPYSLTIIDTPSYGTNDESLELFRGEKTVKLFLEFFRDEAGIKELDMICYVIMEAGVFNSVLSIFSNDVKENINCWQPSDYLGDTCKWQQIPRRFVSVLSKMKPKSMALTQQVLEVMERLKESVDNLQPIFRMRSKKIKGMENAKLMVATCEAQIKAYGEKLDDDQRTEEIEIKWTCLLSGSQDLLTCLQLDLDMNKNEMLEHFVTALRCVQQLKKNSRRNPFLTQKLCDFLFEIEQQLKLCPTDNQT